jgi:hypothetical protein
VVYTLLVGGLTVLIMAVGGFSIMEDYLRNCGFSFDEKIPLSYTIELCKPLRTIQFGVLGIGIIGLALFVYALIKSRFQATENKI